MAGITQFSCMLRPSLVYSFSSFFTHHSRISILVTPSAKPIYSKFTWKFLNPLLWINVLHIALASSSIFSCRSLPYSFSLDFAAGFNRSKRDLEVEVHIGSNCPGISGTVPDLLTLSLVPEGLPICPGRSLISS